MRAVPAWTQDVPQLTGRTVAVREVMPLDAPTLFELLTEPAVTEHISPPPPSIGAFAGFIAWAQRERATGNGVCFGIVPHGLEAAVGIIQVRALEPTFFIAEWGFALAAAFWGTGVFIEAAGLVADFAFTTLKTHRLEARAVGQNARGLGALQKLGARPEGTLARSFRRRGRFEDQLLWALTGDDWRQRPLLQERISAEEAARRIGRAIADARAVFAAGRTRAVGPAAAFPFFLTDSEPD